MPTPHRRRPKRLRARRPDLSEAEILSWCDDFHAKWGEWPTQDSNIIFSAIGETWPAIDAALRQGYRSLPGGSSLARLLARHRGRRNKKGLPALTEEVVAALADVHCWWTGHWPNRDSGPVLASPVPDESWGRVNDALVTGCRGFPGGSSLARLLAERRSARNRKSLPRLQEKQIVRWADAYFSVNGKYPSEKAGAVEEAPGETWCNISAALQQGLRGLPGGSSLFKLLVKCKRVSEPKSGT